MHLYLFLQIIRFSLGLRYSLCALWFSATNNLHIYICTVHLFKEYLFIVPVWHVLTFATLCFRMVANILRISHGFRMVAKRV